MEKFNKLMIPVTILLACIILGGFYYATEASKQASIERQAQAELQQKQDEQQALVDQNNKVAAEKAMCVSEAQQNAEDLNTSSCARGDYCLKGTGAYLVVQYNNAYTTCLEGYGLQ